MIDLPPPPPALLDHAALFLDFDGTLVEIAETPGGVDASGLPHLLEHLSHRLDGHVAIVSGRAVAEVAQHLAPAHLAIAGSHGLEMARTDGSVVTPERGAGLDRALAAAADLRARHPGVLIEDKPFGVGLHYRAAPAAEADTLALAEALAAEHGLLVQRGKMVAELRLPGHDKGSAVRDMMTEPSWSARRPVFMGDDVTDEAGFAAAAALGGAGVLVGDLRDTAARYRLPSVAAVRDWLAGGAA